MTYDKEETIIFHLVEFRKRFIYSLACFVITLVISLFYASTLYQWLTSGFDKKLVVLGPNDILWIYLTLAGLCAIVITLPFVCYQIWLYIRPALLKKEARSLLIYIPAIFICFVTGLAFGFFVITPSLLTVLLSIGDELFLTQLTAENYLTFVINTTVPIAILFEAPVIIAFLTSINLITPNLLIAYRRYAYFILLIISVIITPADLISDLLMTIPLFIIYELSVVVSKVIYNRKRGK